MASHASTRNVLEKFLKEHEGEWWTPHEIKKELGGDIRTVIKGIRNLSRRTREMTCKGWRLETAERTRIYAVRMKRDVEISSKLNKADVSEVDVKRSRVPTSSMKESTLDNWVRPRAK